MTNKMKLVFLITTTISAIIVVLSTPFAVDFCGQALSVFAQALGLHGVNTPSVLTVMVIPAGLYLAIRQRRHS